MQDATMHDRMIAGDWPADPVALKSPEALVPGDVVGMHVVPAYVVLEPPRKAFGEQDDPFTVVLVQFVDGGCDERSWPVGWDRTVPVLGNVAEPVL